MPGFTDKWIAANSPISSQKLHALGVVNYRWNKAEFTLKILSMRFGFGGKGDFVANWAEVHDKGDATIYKTIGNTLKAGKWHKEQKEAVLYALSIYEANRLNRNQLSHFVPHFSHSDLSRVGSDYEQQPFPDSLEDIRRVADEIESLNLYMSDLFSYFMGQFRARLRGVTLPLPDRPPVPKTLWNSPQEIPAPRREKPPRPPSVPKLTEEEKLAKAKKDARLKAEPRPRPPSRAARRAEALKNRKT